MPGRRPGQLPRSFSFICTIAWSHTPLYTVCLIVLVKGFCHVVNVLVFGGTGGWRLPGNGFGVRGRGCHRCSYSIGGVRYGSDSWPEGLLIMLVRNVGLSDLESALAAVNAVFSDNVKFRRCDLEGGSRGGGSTYRVTLTIHDSSAPGSRKSAAGQRISAACYHVYGTFMDSLPDAATITVSNGGGQRTIKPGDSWEDWKISYWNGVKWASELCDCVEVIA